MAGLLDALKSYINDALPGGLLNPETQPVRQKATVLAGLLRDYQAGNTQTGQRLAGLLNDPADVSRLGQRKIDAMTGSDWTPTNSIRDRTGNAMAVVSMAPLGMVTGGPIAELLNQKYGDLLDASLLEPAGKPVVLSKVVVPKENRNSGVGTQFMNDLTSLADEQGRTLALSPANDFGGSKARLVDFYRRFGFVPNKGRSIDYSISESMYREPQ